ncbi:MAG: VWA domain-containing protein [Anaerolineae bacterium]
MKRKNTRGLLLLVGLLSLGVLACSLSDLGDSSGPPRNAVTINILANSTLAPWLRQAVDEFNSEELQTADERPVYALLEISESGQAVSTLSSGSAPTLWIPDEQVWVNALADQGNDSYQGDCVSVAQSPLVIGMWRRVAESLGWPGLPLGWLDVGSLAADPSAWSYYSGGEFGDTFRLGHTHPGLSGTGTSTLLALVQAAQSKTDAVTVNDIQQPIVQASVGAFEGGVAWFSNSSDTLGSTMGTRDVSYLGAAVMYESTVIYYGHSDIVPIYPLEGTFVANFPACINQTTDTSAQEAARIFRDYLLGETAQSAAVTFGLRPVNDNIPIGPPLDESHGVDLTQPVIIFNNPSVDAVYAVQELWQSARKDVNLVMLIDTSGSMRGSKIESVREAAVQFVEQMGDDDFITILAFSSEPRVLVEHVQVGPSRNKIINVIMDLQARGDTSLYDAIGEGAAVIAQTTSVNTTNALVVLTDGQDTNSSHYDFNEELIQAARGNDTTVFTIAYGSDADQNILSELALQANGNFYLGDGTSIAAIYEEMSAAFGGSAGVGR